MERLEDETTPAERAESLRLSQRRERPRGIVFFAEINLGLAITAIGIALFKAPNHFALGGTSGISIILSTLFPALHVGSFMWIVNAGLVLLGLVFLDRTTMGWTVFSSFALSAYVSAVEWALPLTGPLTGDTMLELIFAVLLPAVGSAIVFNIGASTGGTDILAMILRRHTSLEIGKALMVSDALIVLAAFALYGPHTGLYCVLGLVCKTLFIDGAIESINQRKVCTVLCRDPRRLVRFIVHGLHRTATLRSETGAFKGQRYEVVVTVLTRREATKLRLFLQDYDREAFLTMVNSSEIVGRGFRGM